MWMQALSLIGKPLLALWQDRRKRKHLLEKLAAHTEGSISLSAEETRAYRVRNMAGTWADEYILLWVTGLATYGIGFGAPWGGDPEQIEALLTHPVILGLIGGCYGVQKWLK